MVRRLLAEADITDLPHLETARLRLRPRGPEDLEDCLAMDLDPAVAMQTWGEMPDPATHRTALEARLGPDWPAAGGVWVVEEKAAPGFLGWCGLFPLQDSGFVEIGYRYRPAAWGRGLATEAAARVLDHGFRDFALDPIVAVSDPKNRPSHRVLEKIGLKNAGTAFYYDQVVWFFRLGRGDYLAHGERP